MMFFEQMNFSNNTMQSTGCEDDDLLEQQSVLPILPGLHSAIACTGCEWSGMDFAWGCIVVCIPMQSPPLPQKSCISMHSPPLPQNCNLLFFLQIFSFNVNYQFL